MNILSDVNKKQIIIRDINFNVGDKVCVNFKITDSNIRKKDFNFEGQVISIKKNGLNTTCTIRKISFNEGVEKTFFLHSPNINWIKILKKNPSKKSKIYYKK